MVVDALGAPLAAELSAGESWASLPELIYTTLLPA